MNDSLVNRNDWDKAFANGFMPYILEKTDNLKFFNHDISPTVFAKFKRDALEIFETQDKVVVFIRVCKQCKCWVWSFGHIRNCINNLKDRSCSGCGRKKGKQRVKDDDISAININGKIVMMNWTKKCVADTVEVVIKR